MVVAETRRLWGESAGVETGEEDHQSVEERALPLEPEDVVSDDTENHDPGDKMDERNRPYEPGRRPDRRQDPVVACLAVVQGQAPASSEQHEGGDDDALTSQEVQEVAPEVERRCHVVEVLNEREAGGRQAGHGVEGGIDGSSVVTGEDERDRSDRRNHKPRQSHDHHPVAPIEAFVRRAVPQTELAEKREDTDHQKERCERMPFASEHRPHEGQTARCRNNGEDSTERETDNPEVLAFRSNQHVTWQQ